MKKTRGSEKRMKMPVTPAVRASISFPPALYETLEEIAKQKKLSLALVVRDAAENYAIRAAVETPRRQGKS
jgi:metal-responsive CopG/Arc/MetJ family transcriptional regulator